MTSTLFDIYEKTKKVRKIAPVGSVWNDGSETMTVVSIRYYKGINYITYSISGYGDECPFEDFIYQNERIG